MGNGTGHPSTRVSELRVGVADRREECLIGYTRNRSKP